MVKLEEKNKSSKVVLITGGSRGIGAAAAKRFAREGFNVCVNYRQSAEAVDGLLSELSQYPVKVEAVKADVSSEAGVLELFKQLDERFGRLDVLVNNVGMLLPQCKVADVSEDRLSKMLATNVQSFFLCSREAIGRMVSDGGSIVNVSSAASRLGSPNEYVDYASTKGAMDTFTRGLSLELAPQGIRVNCVRPGFIYTDIHADGGEPGRVDRVSSSIPLGRGGKPSEVANAIYWLASDEASYVTGSFIDLAGGR